MKKLLLSLCAIILFAAPAEAASDNPEPERDSALIAYGSLCRDHLRQPEILAMCDTLRRLSIEKGDPMMESTAMVYIVDYYSSQNNLDSLKMWMERIGKFSRKHDMPKPYYFVWNTLVSYYSRTMQYTMALYEIEKMLKQAKQEDYKFGVAQAYVNMGNIYLLKGINASAAEYYKKATEYILTNKLDEYTLNSTYSQLATALTSMQQYEEALAALDASEKHLMNPKVKYIIDCNRAIIYSKMGESQKALAILRNIERNRPAFLQDDQLFEVRMNVYEGSGNYPEALKAVNALMNEYNKAGQQESYSSEVIEKRAHILAAMGHTKEAYEDMVRFSELYKTKVSREGESALAEFATLMGVEQLNLEKAELEQQAQADRLRRNGTLITGLVLTLLLAIAFIIAQVRSKRSLHKAKKAAEEANRMKGEFIRHITHEVNTPLNAIVGFTQLAILTPDNDPERPGYIDILNENSDYLQKLIDDILYVSDIESADTEPEKNQSDILDCCRHAMNNVTHLQKPEIELSFRSDAEQLPAVVPAQYIIKITTELLRNAFTFTQSGHIELSAGTTDNGHLFITVTDTGCGVPASESEHIFDRFVKLNSFSHGMGIGLAVSRMIAHTMNGEIRLDTSHIGGARFIFTFPAA